MPTSAAPIGPLLISDGFLNCATTGAAPLRAPGTADNPASLLYRQEFRFAQQSVPRQTLGADQPQHFRLGLDPVLQLAAGRKAALFGTEIGSPRDQFSRSSGLMLGPTSARSSGALVVGLFAGIAPRAAWFRRRLVFLRMCLNSWHDPPPFVKRHACVQNSRRRRVGVDNCQTGRWRRCGPAPGLSTSAQSARRPATRVARW